MIFNRKKRKFLAVFVLRERETFHIIGKRRIRASTRKVRYRRGTYPVDVSFPTYTKKNKNIYFLDVKVINQILMNDDLEVPEGFEFRPNGLDKSDSPYNLMSPQTLDTLVSGNFIRNLLTSLIKSSPSLMMLFIGILAGVGIGWIVRDLITGGYF